MKTIVSIAGGLLFAFLFHGQHLGINVLIFSAFLLTALLISNRKVLWSIPLVGCTVGLFGSAIAIAYHGSVPAIWGYFACLLLFLGYIASSRSSIYVSMINGAFNVVFGIFHDFIYPKTSTQETNHTPTKYTEWLLGAMIPIVLVVVFASFYSSINPIFGKWMNYITEELSGIDFLWFFTATVASFIMLNIIQPKTIQELETADALQGNHLTRPKSSNQESPTELKIGTYSLMVLNLLLILVLVSEFMFLTNLGDFTAADLSKAVHQGVYSSIASVLVAISLIAFVFRGSINWMKSNALIKAMANTWMGLNLLLLVTIALKNMAYITSYGLTEKRIGVLIYLVLCFIGIITVFFKVKNANNFTFLLRKNLSWGIGVLAIAAWVNWAAVISSYNIDHDYVELELLYEQFPQNSLVLKKTGYYDQVLNQGLSPYFAEKYSKELKERSWQEFNYILFKTGNNEK